MSLNPAQIEGVIFDMDGVLFLSSDCHARAFKETLAEVGVNDFTYEPFAGMRTDEVFRRVFAQAKRDLTDDLLQVLVAKKQQRARAALSRDGKISDYSDELIIALDEKYRLAIASSASRRTVDIYLEKCRFPHMFEFCLDGSMVSEAKPSPEIYLHALEKLDLRPEQCVVIEDAEQGVRAAVRAGIPVIAVVGNDDPAKFLQFGATMVVSGLKDVEPLLHKERL